MGNDRSAQSHWPFFNDLIVVKTQYYEVLLYYDVRTVKSYLPIIFLRRLVKIYEDLISLNAAKVRMAIITAIEASVAHSMPSPTAVITSEVATAGPELTNTIPIQNANPP